MNESFEWMINELGTCRHLLAILVSSFSHDRPKPAKVQDQKHTSQNIAKKNPAKKSRVKTYFLSIPHTPTFKKHFNI